MAMLVKYTYAPSKTERGLLLVFFAAQHDVVGESRCDALSKLNNSRVESDV